jgi:hypothetical protein
LAREAIPAEAIPAVTAIATNAARITPFIGIPHLLSGRMSGFDRAVDGSLLPNGNTVLQH